MAKTELAVAAVQLNSQAQLDENLEQVRTLVRRASARGAELVALPENFAFFGPEADKRRIAERLEDEQAPIVRALSELARECRVHLVAGGFPERSQDSQRPHNTLLVLS